jgi:hypothetical protein
MTLSRGSDSPCPCCGLTGGKHRLMGYVESSPQQFYEEMIDAGWFILTPDGVESTPEYERFNDGSPAT